MTSPINGNLTGSNLLSIIGAVSNPASLSAVAPPANTFTLAGTGTDSFNSILSPSAPGTPGIFDFPSLMQQVQKMLDELLHSAPKPAEQPAAEQPAAEQPAEEPPAEEPPQADATAALKEKKGKLLDKMKKAKTPAQRKKLRNKIKSVNNDIKDVKAADKIDNLATKAAGDDADKAAATKDLITQFAAAKPGSDEAKELRKKIRETAGDSPEVTKAINEARAIQTRKQMNDLIAKQKDVKPDSKKFDRMNAKLEKLDRKEQNLNLQNKQESLLGSENVQNADQVRSKLTELAKLDPASPEAAKLKDEIRTLGGDSPEVDKLIELESRQKLNSKMAAQYDKLADAEPGSKQAKKIKNNIRTAANQSAGVGLDGRVDRAADALGEDVAAKVDKLNGLDPNSKEAKDLRKEIAADVKGKEGGSTLLNLIRQRELNTAEGKLLTEQDVNDPAASRKSNLERSQLRAKRNRLALGQQLDGVVAPGEENKDLRADLSKLAKLDPSSKEAKDLRAKIKKENGDNENLDQALNITSRMGSNADIARDYARLAKAKPGTAQAKKVRTELQADEADRRNLAVKAEKDALGLPKPAATAEAEPAQETPAEGETTPATTTPAATTPAATNNHPHFGSLNEYLTAQGTTDPNNTNQLLANSGAFINQLTGIQYTPFDPDKILGLAG